MDPEQAFRANPWMERQVAALVDPLNDGASSIARHRYIGQAGDGALITTILAVDR